VSPKHIVACPPTIPQVVLEQPAHTGWPSLQQARQKAICGLVSSVAHAAQFGHTLEISQRAPSIPNGVQVPFVQPYPGAQFIATFWAVHWLVQAAVGMQ
jgi:hypothetical protein